jgi:hypothetical protein
LHLFKENIDITQRYMTVARALGRWVEVELDDGRRERLRRELFELLHAIRRSGSISGACKNIGVTLKTGLSWLREAEGKLGFRLVERSGADGGGLEAPRGLPQRDVGPAPRLHRITVRGGLQRQEQADRKGRIECEG